MFAVPGWSLSAADLKRQTEIPQSSRSKKRKRNPKESEDANSKVTSNDVEKLWQSQFDRKDSKKAAKKAEKNAAKNEDGPKETPKSTKKPGKGQEQQQSSGADAQSEGKSLGSERKKHKKQRQENGHESTITDTEAPTTKSPNPRRLQQSLPPPPPTAPNGTKLTPMQAAMRAKLISARFRHLNETLYTTSSNNASQLFSQNPAFFNEYHEGFRQQVENWPENPIDCFLRELERRSTSKPSQDKPSKNKKHKDKPQPPKPISSQSGIDPLPRTHGTCTIADLGAGDATLAQRLITNSLTTSCNLKILSYDLAAPNSLVTKADIANLPLPDGSINLTIFCLALMGTNWPDFIDEAWRVLHWKGELWIAEIKSRFSRESGKQGNIVEHSISNRQRRKRGLDVLEQQREQAEESDLLRKQVDGVEDKDESTDVGAFVGVLQKRGFALEGVPDLANKMFVRMRFIKSVRPVKGKNVDKDLGQQGRKKLKFVEEDENKGDDAATLKPCLYKLR